MNLPLLRERTFHRALTAALFLVAPLLWPSSSWAQGCTNCTTTTTGSDVIHRFTAGAGTFIPPADVTSVTYLVVAGGGGGGGITNTNAGGAGGGGAGGLRAGTLAVIPGTTYNITVGAGGAGSACTTGTCAAGANGGNSIFATITSTGGGRGGYVGNNNGANGGSGGGGRLLATGAGGTGTAGQGNDGGDGNNSSSAGGGGGAGAAGANAAGTGAGGAGGAGLSNSITGAAVFYAGGGGGGGYDGPAGGAGGNGGGGGAPTGRGAGTAGTANTGGGGGGASGSDAGNAFSGGAGGIGVVIVRYTTNARFAVASTNWDVTTTWSAAGCSGAAGATVPAAGSDVVICDTRTVTLNTNSANLGSLTIQNTGILNIGNNTTARTLTVAGDVSNDGTLQYNTAAAHVVSIGGDFNNNDTLTSAAVAGAKSLTVAGLITNASTGIFQVAGNGVFTVNANGGLTNDGNLSYTTAQNHVINVTGAFTNSGTFTSAAVAGTKTLTVSGLINNSGTFRFAGSAAMTVNANGGVTNSSTFDVSTASNITHTLNVGANFTNNGTVTLAPDADSLVNGVFNGSAAQTITGSSGGTTFPNLTLNNANGLTLTGTHNVTVNTTLTLTSGRITTNANYVYVVSGNAVTGAGANAFVVGNLRKRFTATGDQTRIFEVGTVTGGNRYAPVSVRLGNVTAVGDFTVSSTAGDHPSIAASTLDPNLSINRYWTLTNNSVTFGANANTALAFTYVNPGDYDAGASFADFLAGRYNAPTWTELTPTGRTATTTTISGLGVTTATIAGDYQIAEKKATQPVLASVILACGTTNQIEVTFSLPVTAASAQNPANYALSGGATISAAVLDSSGQIVTLTTSTLAAGQGYTLTVNNVVATGGGTIVPNSQAQFFSESAYLPGLLGNYYDQNAVQGQYFTGTVVQRVDSQVNFDWAAGAPGPAGIGADDFSVRWTGFVMPTTTGDYTFRTRSDDGVRLYVNGVLVINNWTDHAATNNDSAVVTLTANQHYTVRMEFYERGGEAVAQLLWSGPGTGGFVAIPTASLSYCGARAAPLAFYKMDEATWNGTAGEVQDASGNGFGGQAVGGAVPTPAKVCNGAQLNAVSPGALTRYVEIPHNARFNQTANLTVTAWIRPAQLPASDLMTVASKDANWEIHVTPAGQINWWWNTGTTALTTSGAAAAPINTWTHVAIVFALGQQTIYVNGVSRATGTSNTVLTNNAVTIQIGDDHAFGGGSRRFRGQIDEVRIYDSTLTQTDVQTIMNDSRPCVSSIDHYYVQHATTGVNCQAENVVITAHTTGHVATSATGRQITITAARVAGAAGNHGDYTLASGTGTLANGTLDDGVATYSFGAGETGVTLAFKDTWEQTVNFQVEDTLVSDITGTASADGGYNQNLAFSRAGIRFIDGSNNAISQVQTAGVTSAANTLFLQAIQSTGCSTPGACTGVCSAAFDAKTVLIGLASECVNPSTCAGSKISINGTPVNNYDVGSLGAYTPVSITFAGSNSTAPFTLNYPDVGQMRLSASYTIPLGTVDADPSSNTMIGTSAPFVVKPYGFTVSNIKRTAGGTANPAATDASGAVFAKAGEAFTVTVTAINAGGNRTPNYGRESSPEGVKLTAALVGSLGLTANPGLLNGIVAGGEFGAGGTVAADNAGEATVTNVAFGEVGIITLTPSVGDDDYLGALNVTGTPSGNVGRFIPDHFDVTLNSPQFVTACAAGNFTYVGQPFVYGTAPVVTVTARNLGGTTTQNYKGTSPASQAWWKITNASLSGKAYTINSGTLTLSGLPTTDPVIAAAGNGTGTLTFGSGTGLAIARSVEVIPYDAEISLAINVIDADGVTYASNPARFGLTTSGGGIAFSATKQMRFGRLKLGNAHGSQLLDLPIPLETQYYNSSGVFTTNTADSCTTLALGNLSLSSGTATLGAFAAGKGNLKISKPGSKVSIDLCVDLDGSSPTDSSCVGTVPANKPWLQWKWSGSTPDRDPKARATFGVFKNADEFIYLRELY